MIKEKKTERFYFGVIATLFIAIGLAFQLEQVVNILLSAYHLVVHTSLNFSFRSTGISYVGQVIGLFGLVLLVSFTSKIFRPQRDNPYFIILVYTVIFSFFFTRIFIDSINIPIWDDYQTILGFMNEWKEEGSFIDKLLLVFKPFYESRMVLLRVLNLVVFGIFGEVSFKTLIIIVNICYVVLFILLIFMSNMSRHKLYFFIPLAILLFQFQSFDCLLWATAGFNFIFTLVMAGCAFWLLDKKGNLFFVLAVFCGIMASLTYGNGLLVNALVVLQLLIQKRKIKAVLVTLFMIVFYCWYFSSTATGPVNASNTILWYDYPLYYFAFCGSAFRFFYSQAICIGMGIVMNVFFFLILRMKNMETNKPLFFFMFFILLSAALTTILRAGEGGLSQALSPRYGTYSIVLFVCIIISCMEIFYWVRWPNFFRYMVVFALSIHILSGFMFYPEAIARKRILKDYMNYYKIKNSRTPPWNGILYNPWLFGSLAEEEMDKAIKNKVYKP